jgi:hypothetical protein
MTHLDLALNYISKGYYVHPLCWPDSDGRCDCGRGHDGNEVGKAPLLVHGSMDATRDEATIRAWWERWPHANIGYDTKQTGIVDIASDCPEWARTFAERGMPHSTLYTSGGGPGHWHTLYRLPVGTPARNINKPGQFDILAAGNTVAPGSAHRSGRVYTLKTDLLPIDELPEAPTWVVEMLRDAEQTSAEDDDLDLALLEKRRGNIEVILARVRPTLPKMAREALDHPDRCPSYSEARWRVIGGLMHLPNEEIAALIHYWADEGTLPWGHLDGKKLRQKNGDIVRCIRKREAAMAKRGKPRTISPTRGAGTLPAQPLTKPRARSDRPQRLTAAQLLAWYRTEANSGVVLMTQTEVAQAHHLSTRTIIRLEQKLDGQIERIAKQHQSYIRLRASSDNIAAVSELEIAASDVCVAENDEPPTLYKHASLSEQAGEQETPTDAPPVAPDLSHLENASPPLTLTELVREAFDVLAADKVRLSFSRIRRYVEANAGGRTFSPAAIVRRYDQERDDRAWQREIDRLRTTKIGKLNALDKRTQAILADGPGARMYRWASAIYPHISAELERRAEMRERLRTGPRPTRSVDQALLLAEVEDQIAEHRASTKTRKRPLARAACSVTESVPVQTTPIEPPASIDSSSLIARLKAQRDARQAAAS